MDLVLQIRVPEMGGGALVVICSCINLSLSLGITVFYQCAGVFDRRGSIFAITVTWPWWAWSPLPAAGAVSAGQSTHWLFLTWGAILEGGISLDQSACGKTDYPGPESVGQPPCSLLVDNVVSRQT